MVYLRNMSMTTIRAVRQILPEPDPWVKEWRYTISRAVWGDLAYTEDNPDELDFGSLAGSPKGPPGSTAGAPGFGSEPGHYVFHSVVNAADWVQTAFTPGSSFSMTAIIDNHPVRWFSLENPNGPFGLPYYETQVIYQLTSEFSIDEMVGVLTEDLESDECFPTYRATPYFINTCSEIELSYVSPLTATLDFTWSLSHGSAAVTGYHVRVPGRHSIVENGVCENAQVQCGDVYFLAPTIGPADSSVTMRLHQVCPP